MTALHITVAWIGIAPAVAQETEVRQLPPIVVTGSRIPATLDRVTAATTVFTREEIEAPEPSSVTDLLR